MKTIYFKYFLFAALCVFPFGIFAQHHMKPFLQTDNMVLYHGSRSKKVVALTFDACPAYGPHSFDRNVYQTLIDSQVPATVFLSGKWIRTHAKEMEALAANPRIEFGNHSYSHPHLTSMPHDSILLELQKVQQIMKNTYHRTAKLFRAPYAELNDDVVRSADSLGLTTVQFDVVSGDPDTLITKNRLVPFVVHSARNGSIIIMHINGRGWHTAEALPDIIAGLRKRGFRFVNVSELLPLRSVSKPEPVPGEQ
jgi:peptidoglycan/xylan/chitin deacetylase (PgdA/CDA1 family)